MVPPPTPRSARLPSRTTANEIASGATSRSAHPSRHTAAIPRPRSCTSRPRTPVSCACTGASSPGAFVSGYADRCNAPPADHTWTLHEPELPNGGTTPRVVKRRESFGVPSLRLRSVRSKTASPPRTPSTAWRSASESSERTTASLSPITRYSVRRAWVSNPACAVPYANVTTRPVITRASNTSMRVKARRITNPSSVDGE